MAKVPSEADLCRDFIVWASTDGWTAYAETAGWDVVLVRGAVQIGVHAKKAFNATLLRQALDHCQYSEAPQYRGILIPRFDAEVSSVCTCLGLIYFRPLNFGKGFCPGLDNVDLFERQFWPGRGITLPDYIPDVVAGASAPVQLTKWKIAALKICAILELTGTVDRPDFKRLGIDHRRWFPMKWLGIENGRYVRGPNLNFDRQHPVVYQQILTEMRAELANGK